MAGCFGTQSAFCVFRRHSAVPHCAKNPGRNAGEKFGAVGNSIGFEFPTGFEKLQEVQNVKESCRSWQRRSSWVKHSHALLDGNNFHVSVVETA